MFFLGGRLRPALFTLLSLAMVILYCGRLSAQSQVISGKVITSKETWSGTVIIEGDVEVAAGALLTIEAGTRVLFKPQTDASQSGQDKTRSELIVKGRLTAKGQLGNNIFFSSYSEDRRMGDWYGIVFLSPKQMSILDYCVVEYAFNGLTIKKASPLIRNSQIRLNYNSGIVAEVKSDARIIKNIISENGYAGMIASLGAQPILSENMISLNQIGIIIFSMARPNLGNLSEGEDYNIGANRIFDNAEYDLYNHTALPIMAENNSWGNRISATELAARIYDGEDEQRYGIVDLRPLMGSSNLDDLLRLSQGSQTNQGAITQSPLNNAANNNTQGSPPDTAQTQPSFLQRLINAPVNSTNGDEQIVENNSGTESETEPQDNSATRQNDLPIQIPQSTPALTAANQPGEALETESESAAINYEQIFLEAFLDDQRRIVRKIAPRVTDASLRQFKGKVIVRAVVSTDGDVESVSILRGLNPYLDRISLEAARQFRFEVGTIKGVPVRFYTNIAFEF